MNYTSEHPELIERKGFDFKFDPAACRKCAGRCCNGTSGHIMVSRKELVSIAGFLRITPEKLIRNYLKKVGYKFSIREQQTGENYACLFFDTESGQCRIYPVRPRQCRSFPFWDCFKQHPEKALEECPGVIMDPKALRLND